MGDMAKLSDVYGITKTRAAKTVKTLPRAAVGAAVRRAGPVSRETREPAAPVTTGAGGQVPPEAPGEVVSEGPGYGKPFLLQVTVRQEERLEEERRILGFRSRAETIRYYLEMALKQAAKGRLE